MGKNKIHAVLDTNVIVSAFISDNINSNPTIVLRETLRGKITPVYNDEILNEYEEVLSRDKFHFQRSDIPQKPFVVTPAEMVEILGSI